MVNMKEILGGIFTAFKPFIGKAIITIVILGALGLLIDVIAHKIRNKKN